MGVTVAQQYRPGLKVNKSNDWSFTWGTIDIKILISPGCPGPSIALQCRIVALNTIASFMYTQQPFYKGNWPFHKHKDHNAFMWCDFHTELIEATFWSANAACQQHQQHESIYMMCVGVGGLGGKRVRPSHVEKGVQGSIPSSDHS